MNLAILRHTCVCPPARAAASIILDLRLFLEGFVPNKRSDLGVGYVSRMSVYYRLEAIVLQSL